MTKLPNRTSNLPSGSGFSCFNCLNLIDLYFSSYIWVTVSHASDSGDGMVGYFPMCYAGEIPRITQDNTSQTDWSIFAALFSSSGCQTSSLWCLVFVHEHLCGYIVVWDEMGRYNCLCDTGQTAVCLHEASF